LLQQTGHYDTASRKLNHNFNSYRSNHDYIALIKSVVITANQRYHNYLRKILFNPSRQDKYVSPCCNGC